MTATAAHAQRTLQFKVGATVNTGFGGELAPTLISANTFGTVSQKHSVMAMARVVVPLDTTKRFAWSVGIEAWTGYTSSANYLRYTSHEPTLNAQHPPRAWIQQCFAEIKYRKFVATLGSKQEGSANKNDELSSGDLVRSANSRPFPGLEAKTLGFVSIPGTKDWLQVDAEIGFYRTTDTHWLENHYNQRGYYYSPLTTDHWYHYKRLFLRTNPNKAVVFTAGAQASCFIGGTSQKYEYGELKETIRTVMTPKLFWRAFFPWHGSSGGDVFCEGSHLGSWDLKLTVNLPYGDKLHAYYQNLWEDGSGMAKLNGWDGLYGIEYSSGERSLISGAVIEYLDFTNQSGPIHFAPADFPDSKVTGAATGGDNYYNNYAYSGYMSHGFVIGNSMVTSPIYSQQGYLNVDDTRIRAIHCALKGYIGKYVDYRLMFQYRKSWGRIFTPAIEMRTSTAMLFEATYTPKRIPRLKVKAQCAFDHGNIVGNNTGFLVNVSYNGRLTF